MKTLKGEALVGAMQLPFILPAGLPFLQRDLISGKICMKEDGILPPSNFQFMKKIIPTLKKVPKHCLRSTSESTNEKEVATNQPTSSSMALEDKVSWNSSIGIISDCPELLSSVIYSSSLINLIYIRGKSLLESWGTLFFPTDSYP